MADAVVPRSAADSVPETNEDTIRELDIPSAPPRGSWWRRLRWADHLHAFSPSLTLQNSGSVARDHLASERTWLAYVRTSLAVSSTGVVLVQLFTISGQNAGPVSSERLLLFARPLGAATVALALVVLVIGVWRYFAIQRLLTQGKFPAAKRVIIFLTAALAALIAVVFGVLVSVSRE